MLSVAAFVGSRGAVVVATAAAAAPAVSLMGSHLLEQSHVKAINTSRQTRSHHESIVTSFDISDELIQGSHLAI